MKVLVTGARGLIGRALVERLEAAGHQTEELAGDVRRRFDTSFEADAVVHLAGILKPSEGDSPRQTFDVNVIGTANALAYCERSGARMLLASSAAVYRPTEPGAVVDEDAELDPRAPYALSKWLAERLCEQWAEEKGGRAVALRVFNVYGPGQPLPFIVPYVVDCVRRGQAVALRSPEAVRDFVHVDDVATAFFAAVDSDLRGYAVLNIGSGVGTSVRELAELTFRVAETPPAIEADAGAERAAVVADIARAATELDWRPRRDLAAGLAELIHG